MTSSRRPNWATSTDKYTQLQIQSQFRILNILSSLPGQVEHPQLTYNFILPPQLLPQQLLSLPVLLNFHSVFLLPPLPGLQDGLVQLLYFDHLFEKDLVLSLHKLVVELTLVVLVDGTGDLSGFFHD